MMTPERWQRVRDVLEQALELAPEKRARFLDVACAADLSLRNEVQSFLAADDRAASSFLETPPLRTPLLTAGTKLGDYEIVSQVGAGGMGVVYRARDLRLGRPVAIKVLGGHLSADANRLRRFEQEAQSAAALNHPNILAVYQLGMYEGAPYLVSELLEGETLREELKRGQLKQSRAIDLAEQIADGLSAAHQRGIIHRDLKPENLYITKEGRLKILDFGLAKLLEEGTGDDETSGTLSFQTNPGTIAGTVGYTSPEQVRGEKLDARTDLFSFGVVLFEMATAERPFAGETSGVIFEAILNRQPVPRTQLNARVSPEFERIITKALEKDREVRYQSAAEIRADLKRLKRDTESGRSASYKAAIQPEKPGGARARRLVKLVSLVALSFLVIIGIWLGYSLAKSALSAILTRPLKNLHAQIDPPPLTSFRLTGDNAGPPVISPTGTFVAFTATGRDGKSKLWVRALNSVDARALPDTDGSTFPFWSADSNSLGFFADGKLKAINVMIGSPVVLCEAPDARGGSWGANGEILFTPTPTSPLLRVPATGGSPRPVTKLEGGKYTTHRWPFILPDQRHFLYFAASHEPSRFGDNTVYYGSLDGRENRPLFHSETNAIFSDGFLLFATGDNLMARAFDFTQGEVAREPISLAHRVINDSVTWHVDVSASDTGMLVYGGTGPGSRQLIWLDRGTYMQTEVAVDGLAKLFLARLSPQGERAVLQKDAEGYDISVYDLRDKITLTSLPTLHNNGYPIWSPDGKWIAYASLRDDQYHIYRMSAEGNGEEQELLRDDTRILPFDWNGSNLLYFRGGLGNEFECRILSLENNQTRRLLDNVDSCRLSPDLQWLAYSARENLPGEKSPGSLNVFVVGIGSRQGKYKVSEESGFDPQWSQDGKELYYLEESTRRFVVVKVTFSSGVPRFHVLEKSSPNMLAEPIYSVSPDKKRILIERIPEPTVVVITNFAEGLEKK
ncbi:MAG TPA: protein kinase [Candidatus Sulfotelmatobacter sp.]|nr:protein kinase [Candidatus Sulfotelmatobacter sp.]